MARRRQFGYVFRKRRPPSKSKDKEGNDADDPGWYIRIRQGEGEIQRYAGGDRATATEFLKRLQTEAEQMQLGAGSCHAPHAVSPGTHFRGTG